MKRFLRTHGGYSVYRVTDYLHPFGSSYLRGLFVLYRQLFAYVTIVPEPTGVILPNCICVLLSLFSSHTGVILCLLFSFLVYHRFLRTHGGYSDPEKHQYKWEELSPCNGGHSRICPTYDKKTLFSSYTRRLFFGNNITLTCFTFSPHTRGVILNRLLIEILVSCFPCTYGGYSPYGKLYRYGYIFAPYLRGLFHYRRTKENWFLLPVSTGVIRVLSLWFWMWLCYPRTRGLFVTSFWVSTR